MSEKTLPNDVARCAGFWVPDSDGIEMREGCADCLRRTCKPADGVTSWVSPPLLIVFECEYRIEK
jgi:hypothetical protein